MMADKAAQHPSKSLNIDLSSSVRGPEQDPTSQPIAETLSQALLNGFDAFSVNCDWPPQTSAMLCARPMKWGATAAAVWAAGDRPRGTVGKVWVGTKYNRPRLTTARRRAPALSLRAAPRTGVGDVPTA